MVKKLSQSPVTVLDYDFFNAIYSARLHNFLSVILILSEHTITSEFVLFVHL